MTSNLPIHAVLDDLCAALQAADDVVLEAPPGAGKTTVVPLALLDQPWLGAQKILMLEPRRLAARMAAQRMADQLAEPVGQTVGYRVRLDTKISAATRIEVVTEGILTRMLQDDPSLEGYGAVIFDEFHERSLDADFGLALMLQGRELFRDDSALKCLLMSATLDHRVVDQLLPDAARVSSEGRMFPVTLDYLGAPGRDQRLEQAVAKAVQQGLAEQSGSLLVFLPGQREIRAVANTLQGSVADNVSISPLYGDLSMAAQQQAIQPAPAGQRKVVLATNIAETSLTIEGIRVVIDAGLSREARLDPASGMTRLHTCKVSRASSIQRMGRAGRMEPGHCYRLWSEAQQEQLAQYTNPEILTADLTPLALQLACWGVDDPSELRWLNPPPAAALQQGRDLLMALGALEQNGQSYSLTEDGELMAGLPMHPRLAHLLVCGEALGLGKLATDLAALLSERDPLSGDADISRRLAWIRGDIPCQSAQKGVLQRIRQLSRQYQSLLAKSGIASADDGEQLSENQQIAVLLAQAYPDRIASRRRDNGSDYQLSGGRAVRLREHDSLQRNAWLVVANCGGVHGQSSDAVYLAAVLDPELFDSLLSPLISSEEVVEWDRQTDRMLCEQQRKVGVLVLSRKELAEVPMAAKNRDLIRLIRKQGLQLLPWNEKTALWRQRVAFLHQACQHCDDNPWPDLSDQALLDTLESWLQPYLDPVQHLNHFRKLDLPAILQGMLPWPLPQQLDEQAPVRLKLPSGHSAQLDYSEYPPVLAVKLQEMFGCTTTPTLANGVAVKIHLLSPARRPLQVTQDLASFWANSYKEVQKDMKGRYPKHQWPDDPLQALPSDGIKRKKRN